MASPKRRSSHPVPGLLRLAQPNLLGVLPDSAKEQAREPPKAGARPALTIEDVRLPPMFCEAEGCNTPRPGMAIGPPVRARKAWLCADCFRWAPENKDARRRELDKIKALAMDGMEDEDAD